MRLHPPTYDGIDFAYSDTVEMGKVSLGDVAGTDFTDLFGCQPGLRQLESVSRSPLGPAVSSVVQGIPEKEMIWANAKRNITLVENPLAARQRAVGQLPSYPVRLRCLSVSTRDAEFPIPSDAASRHPQPARVGLVDLLPEPFCERPGWARHFCHLHFTWREYNTGGKALQDRWEAMLVKVTEEAVVASR